MSHQSTVSNDQFSLCQICVSNKFTENLTHKLRTFVIIYRIEHTVLVPFKYCVISYAFSFHPYCWSPSYSVGRQTGFRGFRYMILHAVQHSRMNLVPLCMNTCISTKRRNVLTTEYMNNHYSIVNCMSIFTQDITMNMFCTFCMSAFSYLTNVRSSIVIVAVLWWWEMRSSLFFFLAIWCCRLLNFNIADSAVCSIIHITVNRYLEECIMCIILNNFLLVTYIIFQLTLCVSEAGFSGSPRNFSECVCKWFLLYPNLLLIFLHTFWLKVLTQSQILPWESWHYVYVHQDYLCLISVACRL